LVQAVAAQNNNAIVVIHSVGPLILEPWIDRPNVTAIIWTGLEGTETGNALVDVVYGKKNPNAFAVKTAKSPSNYRLSCAARGGQERRRNLGHHIF
jgi:beta-glucosidase